MKRIKLLFIFMIVILLMVQWVQPLEVYAKSRIEIVFIIDRSGSMGDDISNVRKNINDFTALLEGQGIDYRLGLVTYETYPIKYDLTDNVEKFRGYLNGVNVNGGTENGLDAIMEAIDTYTYYENAAKYFILIGDEPIYSRQHHSLGSVKQSLVHEDIILTNIGVTNASDLVQATGGLSLDLSGDFSTQLTKIFEQIQTIPILEIIAPTPQQWLSGRDHAFIPTVKVTDPDSDQLTLEYYIDNETTPKDSKTVTNTKTEQIIRFNALNIGELTEGQHSFKFTVNDGSETVQDTVTINVDKTPPNLSTVNFASTDRRITVSGSATDTVSGMHSSPYRYTVGTNVSGWTSHTSYTQDSLTPNTEYGVKFEARDNTNHIAVKEQAIYTKAQTPQLSVSDNGVATLQLNVTDNNPASTKYQIKAGSKYVTQTGTLSVSPVWITLTNKRITVKGLAPNTTYALRAKAQNGAGIDTSWSSTVNGTSLADPPDRISAVPGQTDIKVSWNSISGALGYEIEVDGVVKNNGTSTHYTHSGLLPETSHRYRVRVKNAGGTGSWSGLTTAETLPYPPAKVQNIRCSDYTQTTIDLVWDSIPKASVYEVEANGQIIENGASTTFMHTGLIPETAYQYRVRGKNKGGDGEWSEPFTQATLPNPPPKPVGMNTVITKDSVTLSWAAVEKAEGYEVMADGLITDVGMETTYVHAGLAPLSGHTYKVRAVRAGGRVKGQWSDPIDVTTHPEAPVMPANIMSTAEKTVLTVTWYQVPHAESYDVEIDGSTVVNVTDLMYIHRGLTPDTQHSYRIKAKNITGESEWSMPVKAFTLPESDDGTMALTNVVAVVTNTFITLSWDAAALDAEYDIEVDGVLQENGKETIYNHTGLNPNEYHTYKIRVKNSEGIARWCAVLSLSTLPNPPDAPTSIEAFAGNNSIELRWERVEGATGYDIEINGETVTGGADNRYIHQPLEPGTAHTYRVRAKNITGVTAWSPALVKSTTTPSYIVQCSQDKLFDLSLLADNVQDFTALAFTVTYDVNALEVADLYGATPQKDVIDKGNIPGTDIQVTHTPGKIVFTVDKHMIPGTSWSGELAAVVFKGKITGESEINFTVEEGQ